MVRAKSDRPSRRTSAVAFVGDPPDPDDPLLGFAPYLHTAPRRNSITPDRQRAFIAELAATGIVTQAARAIGASLEALYKLRHAHGAAGFSAAWDAALDRGVARLEDCALERALAGEERPVVSMGQVVTTYRRYDTALVLFLLRQRRGDRFDSGGGAVRPGSPAWKRLRAQWEAEKAIEDAEEEADILASLDAKLEAMRLRWIATRDADEVEEDEDDADSDEAEWDELE